MKLKELEAAMAEARKSPALFREGDTVRNVDGVAVFTRANGDVFGWMGWDDFESICKGKDNK